MSNGTRVWEQGYDGVGCLRLLGSLFLFCKRIKIIQTTVVPLPMKYTGG